MKKQKNFKLRYILIPLGIVIVLIVISNIMRLTFIGQVKNMQEAFYADVEQKVNSIVDERLSEFYSNQNFYTPNSSINTPSGSTSTPNTDSNFTDVSWPEDSTSGSSTPVESKKIVANITNSVDTNLPYTDSCNIKVFDSYDEAFDNAFILDTGVYVCISLETTVEVENIKLTASFRNPDSKVFEEFGDLEFRTQMNQSNDYVLTFEIPDNPSGWGYTTDHANFVAVFTIVTNDGTFYVSCAY